jgi:hypothetical protein
VRFALLAGTGILSIDLYAGKSLPVPEMMLDQPSVTAMSFTKTPDAIVDGRQGMSSTFTDRKEPRSGLIARNHLERTDRRDCR